MATRSPLLTPPSSAACQAVGRMSDKSTTLLSVMPSGTFRQFKSAAQAQAQAQSPRLVAPDICMPWQEPAWARSCQGTLNVHMYDGYCIGLIMPGVHAGVKLARDVLVNCMHPAGM